MPQNTQLRKSGTMDDQLVSVIIPTYNRAYCLGRAIDSVRAQSHENWELLLVDDGSTDKTAELIRSTFASDPRIRYIFQKNAGVSAARNTGIRAARGQFIALLDSDDMWKPWKLEMQLACFQSFPDIGMVWSDFEAMDTAGNIVSHRYLRTMYHAYRYFPTPTSLFSEAHELPSIPGTNYPVEKGARAYLGNIYTAMLRGNLVHTSTVLLSRERASKTREFDEALTLSGEDYDFHFRTCKCGQVCFVDIPSTVYQLDFEDRLSQHRVHIATNFLKTVEAAISREKGTRQFPPSMVDEVLAEAHGWLAEELFKAGDRAAVRRHAWRSLGYQSWQPKLAFRLLLAASPPWIVEPLLRAYRYLKRASHPRNRKLSQGLTC